MCMMRSATATTQLKACQFSAALQKGHKFTGKERETESGLDNFGARFNASTMGRFKSPDPKKPSLKHLVNP
jgi:RHS repeat-associated protein